MCLLKGSGTQESRKYSMKHWGMNSDMHSSCASEPQGRLYTCSKYFPFLIFSFPSDEDEGWARVAEYGHEGGT